MINLSRETEALAERLAAAQHLSVENAIKLALEEKARATGILAEPPKGRDMSPAAITARREALERIGAEIAAMPILDPRSPQEIMDDLDSL